MQITENLQYIAERAREIFENSSKKVLISFSVLISLIVLCVVLLIIQLNSKPKKAEYGASENLVSPQNVLPPQSKKLTEDYYYFRETESSWPKEEIEKWFSIPDEEAINKLNQQNSKIIDEILGACP